MADYNQNPFGQTQPFAPTWSFTQQSQQPYNPAEFSFSNDFTDEPPLHEELGLNFGHIKKKTISVMNPFTRTLDPELLDDCDLAGPLVFGALLGLALTLVMPNDSIYLFLFLGGQMDV
jgi:hypothetical protein